VRVLTFSTIDSFETPAPPWFKSWGSREIVQGLAKILPLIDSGLVGWSVGWVVDWFNGFPFITSTPREQKMLKGHLPRVIYHQVY